MVDPRSLSSWIFLSGTFFHVVKTNNSRNGRSIFEKTQGGGGYEGKAKESNQEVQETNRL